MLVGTTSKTTKIRLNTLALNSTRNAAVCAGSAAFSRSCSGTVARCQHKGHVCLFVVLQRASRYRRHLERLLRLLARQIFALQQVLNDLQGVSLK